MVCAALVASSRYGRDRPNQRNGIRTGQGAAAKKSTGALRRLASSLWFGDTDRTREEGPELSKKLARLGGAAFGWQRSLARQEQVAAGTRTRCGRQFCSRKPE